jgi:hypothetical protein
VDVEEGTKDSEMESGQEQQNKTATTQPRIGEREQHEDDKKQGSRIANDSRKTAKEQLRKS